MTRDERFMAAALRSGRRGEGRTRPNPPVGAVIVQGDRIVARGFHRRAGADHAEVDALRRAGAEGRGAELFVTLEPCSHQGRTPPCTRAIQRAGIRRVVVGVRDPNPRVDGRGLRQLRRAGIEVEVGVLGDRCAALISGYRSWIERGRPEVVLKVAASLDGRIATRTGHSRWVTGESARLEGHRWRNRCDAILVGAGTVLADDPALTCRLPRGGRDPIRVVLSGTLRVPPQARAVSQPGPPGRPNAIVFAGRNADAARAQALVAMGAEVVRLPTRRGRIEPGAVLGVLGERDITRLLVEGGSAVAAEFLAAGVVDRVLWFSAPKIVGGVDAVAAVGGTGVSRMDDALQLEDVRVRRIGDDYLFEGRPARTSGT